jgi:hypothetical protein
MLDGTLIICARNRDTTFRHLKVISHHKEQSLHIIYTLTDLRIRQTKLQKVRKRNRSVLKISFLPHFCHEYLIPFIIRACRHSPSILIVLEYLPCSCMFSMSRFIDALWLSKRLYPYAEGVADYTASSSAHLRHDYQ